MLKVRKNTNKKRTIALGAGLILLLSAIFFSSSAQASSFTDSINALGKTTPVTKNLPPDTYNVDSDFTIPWNVTLHFEEGAVINVADGVVFVVSGTIDDCNFKIFNDPNSDPLKGVKLNGGSNANIRPEWWGAKADDNPASAGANADAIEKALRAPYLAGSSSSPYVINATSTLNSGQRVLLSVGKYYINRTVNMKLGSWLVGQGDIKNYDNVSVLRLADNSNCAMLTDRSAGFAGGITNILFHGGSQSSKVVGLEIVGLDYDHNLKNFLLKNNGFTNFNDYAVFMPSSGGHRAMIEGNSITNSYNGMMLGISDGQVRGNEVNFNGEYGIKLAGFDTTFQNNKVSGGSSGDNCLDTGSTRLWAQIIRNEFTNCDYGIVNVAGNISENTISNNRRSGIHAVTGGGSTAIITDNTITGNGEYGIYINGPAEGGAIRRNDVSGNSLGAMNVNVAGHISAIARDLREYSLIENNKGFDDSPDSYQDLSGGSSPGVTASGKWQTKNASPATITDFTKAPRGKEFFLKFGDPRTTLKFSANPSADRILNGNFSSGSDWTIGSYWSYNTTEQTAKHVSAGYDSDGTDAKNPLAQNIGAVKDEYYEVKYTVKNYISGGVMPLIVNDPWHCTLDRGFAPSFGGGIFTRVVKAEAATSLKFITTSDFAGEIDDVSARKIDTALRGFGGRDKIFAEGDEIRCLLGTDTYWYCDDAKLAFNELSLADLNSDSKVDLNDFNILKTDFLKLAGNLANPKSDINADGQATIKDVGIMMSEWKP